jgi:hypothetical protein
MAHPGQLTQSILVIDHWALNKPYARNSYLKVIRSYLQLAMRSHKSW